MAPQTKQAVEAMKAYRAGLAAFVGALDRVNFKDEEAFKPFLRHALDHFGMTVASLSNRVGHSKGAISKWLNTAAMPPQSTREIALRWVREQAEEQLQSMDLDPEEPEQPINWPKNSASPELVGHV